MKAVFEKIPPGAGADEIIKAVNRMAEQLNTVLDNIDEENISDALLERIGKEDK